MKEVTYPLSRFIREVEKKIGKKDFIPYKFVKSVKTRMKRGNCPYPVSFEGFWDYETYVDKNICLFVGENYNTYKFKVFWDNYNISELNNRFGYSYWYVSSFSVTEDKTVQLIAVKKVGDFIILSDFYTAVVFDINKGPQERIVGDWLTVLLNYGCIFRNCPNFFFLSDRMWKLENNELIETSKFYVDLKEITVPNVPFLLTSLSIVWKDKKVTTMKKIRNLFYVEREEGYYVYTVHDVRLSLDVLTSIEDYNVRLTYNFFERSLKFEITIPLHDKEHRPFPYYFQIESLPVEIIHSSVFNVGNKIVVSDSIDEKKLYNYFTFYKDKQHGSRINISYKNSLFFL